MYINKAIKEYLTLLESGDPTPGGGSVSALVSSLGGALTLMTSNFSLDKKYFKELDVSIQEKVKQTHRDIKKSIARFNEFVDEDAEGFASVIRAYDINKNIDQSESEEDKKKRLEESYKKALATPLRCSRECLKLLKLQGIILKYGNQDTVTDVGVGIIIVHAALEGCVISVKINLNYIEDSDYTQKIHGEIENISEEAAIIKNHLKEKIDNILGF